MVSQSSLALDRSFSIEKPSISNGLMRILSEIFFSSSSCSFVLLRSSCADVRLPYIRRDKSINNGWPAYICVFGSAFHPVLWIRTAKSFLVMVKLGPFLLACSFIACIIAWRFFSDSSRRLDKKIGFFFIFQMLLILFIYPRYIRLAMANVLSLFLHITLLLLLCKRKEKHQEATSRENR